MQWVRYVLYRTLTCLWRNLKKNIISNICRNMAQFKEKHNIKYMSLLYLRYIVDIFIIWKGTKEQLITFINELNNKNKTIKFEYEI